MRRCQKLGIYQLFNRPNVLWWRIMDIAGKQLAKNHIAGPVGVRGRNSDNKMIKQRLGWAPSASLRDGLERTYQWIEQQVRAEA